ncbi:hypothetical protein EC988_005064, partial [Linderina pennispora]
SLPQTPAAQQQQQQQQQALPPRKAHQFGQHQLHASASSSTTSTTSSSIVSAGGNTSALPAPPAISTGGNRSRSGSTASNASGHHHALNGPRMQPSYGSSIPASPTTPQRHLNNASPINIPQYGAGTPGAKPGMGSRPTSAHQSGSPSRLQQPTKIGTTPTQQQQWVAGNGVAQKSREDLYHRILMPMLCDMERLTNNSREKNGFCTLADTLRKLEHEMPGFTDVFTKELTVRVNKHYATRRG